MRTVRIGGFRTPSSDHIRHETGAAIMAVGNPHEPGHVHSIPSAGRTEKVAAAVLRLCEGGSAAVAGQAVALSGGES